MLLFSDAIGLVDGDPYSQYPKWNNLALVDADGDDLLDLAFGGLNDRTVWLIRNLGGGEFCAPEELLTGAGQIRDVDAGDVDGDGRPDLLILVKNKVRLISGSPLRGENMTVAVSTSGQGGHSVRVVDLDGDGHRDLLVAVQNGANRAEWARSINGTGFEAMRKVGKRTGAHLATYGDLDGDGDLDVIVCGDDKPVTWYENVNASALVWTEHELEHANSTLHGSRDACVADFDGDGLKDFAVAFKGKVFDGGDTDPHAVELAWFAGADGFGTRHEIAESLGRAYSVVCADLDADGDTDLAVASQNSTIHVYENDGTGAFQRADAISTIPAGCVWVDTVRVADLDGDGNLDIAAVCRNTRQAVWVRNLIGPTPPLTSVPTASPTPAPTDSGSRTLAPTPSPAVLAITLTIDGLDCDDYGDDEAEVFENAMEATLHAAAGTDPDTDGGIEVTAIDCAAARRRRAPLSSSASIASLDFEVALSGEAAATRSGASAVTDTLSASVSSGDFATSLTEAATSAGYSGDTLDSVSVASVAVVLAAPPTVTPSPGPSRSLSRAPSHPPTDWTTQRGGADSLTMIAAGVVVIVALAAFFFLMMRSKRSLRPARKGGVIAEIQPVEVEAEVSVDISPRHAGL